MRETSEGTEQPPDRSAWRERPAEPPELGETSSSLARSWRERPLREFREQYRKEYREPDTPAVERLRGEPHHDPKEFTASINPHRRESGLVYKRNCCDCARAVELTWRGQPEVAAGRATGKGEDWSRTERWAGTYKQEMSFDQIGERLRAEGHGASAMVEVQYTDRYGRRGGHMFNAVNHEGRVLYVDGQKDWVSDWPPSEHHPEWSGMTIHKTRAIGFDRNGRSWW